MGKIQKNKIYFLILCLLLLSSNVFAHDELQVADLSKLSFDELLNVKISVPAAITQLTKNETPASVTIITKDDIHYTPARNIYDLIEIYVPGAIWMNYEEGPQLGIRGLISSRNTKYLLQLNGRTMNNSAHFGAMSELEQWDLNDIYKIEIIRGPGSVTYGPGAIAGVINIVTHSGYSAHGLQISTNYTNKYKSKSASISYGKTAEKYKFFGYASATRTDGYNAKHFLGTNNQEAGYVGESIELNREPLDYFSDFQNNPQVKLFVDFDFLKRWSFWARYTQQGSTWKGNELKTEFFGETLNLQSMRNRQLTATLEYNRKFTKNISLSSITSFSTSDAQRQKDNPNDPDIDHVLNKQINFGESEILLNGTMTWQASNKIELALGAELSRNHYGAPWGKSPDDMRLGDNGIIVNDINSNAIRAGNKGSADRDSTAIFVGDGWSANSYAIFTEANIELQPWLKLLASGRIDNNTYTKSMFSPRVALITHINKDRFIKLIAQKSVRRNTASQLFTEAQKNLETNTEILRGLELIYTHYLNSAWQINISGLRNEIDIIAWDGDDNATEPLGKLKLYGIEADLLYKWNKNKVGLNYSFINQIDWQLAGGEIRSGVSYSDYNQPYGTTVQTGEGNDLANWPNQALKMYGKFALSKTVNLHLDSRILWDFQGSIDGLNGLSIAVAGTPDEIGVESALQIIRDENAFNLDFRSNASLSYTILDKLEGMLFVQNLIGTNNHRYSYDTGINRPSPKSVRFTEEPRVWGMKIKYEF